jgi:O-antigen/teichoic acid export membrane protein
MPISHALRLFQRADHYAAGLLRGAGVSFLLRVAGAGMAFLFSVVLARTLGADAVGLYFLALTQITFIAVLARLGLDTALLRETAVHVSRGDWAAVLGEARMGIRLVLLTSIGLALGLALLAPWLALHVFSKPGLAMPLRWLALAIPPLAVAFVYGELLKGLAQIARSQLVQVVLLPALAIPVFLGIGPGWGALAASWAYGLAALMAAIVGALLWRRAMRNRGRPAIVSARALLVASLPLMWVQLLMQVISWADILILGMFLPAAEVGLYAVAARTAMLTSFIIVAVNNVIGPRLATLYHQGDLAGLALLAVRSTRLTLLVAAPMLALFVLAPHWVLALFGPDFAAAGAVLAILAAGQFVNVATGSVGQVLIMTGHGRSLRNLSAVSAVLCIALNLVLIPAYGAIGAALATASSVVLLNVLGNLAVYRHHRIHVHALAKAELGPKGVRV